MLFRKRRQKAASQHERARSAGEEAEVSRQRLRAIRQNVTGPLAAAGSRNQFADIIRASLAGGHEGRRG
jgi:hypothetical protein